MVQTMTTAYKALSTTQQTEVYMQAVGKDDFASSNSDFCFGSFGMCSDTSGDPWWNEWNANQRDVYFFFRQDVTDAEWKYYCTYSMNSYEDEFATTIDDLLVLVDQPPSPVPSFSPTITASPSIMGGSSNAASFSFGRASFPIRIALYGLVIAAPYLAATTALFL
mmetsp:Transcript_27197/g.38255  ORF Transcript_27197/g.38255 Transcript_27197/m.38255 type:complete len:165 (-) Transcript_27197:352-846(-)